MLAHWVPWGAIEKFVRIWFADISKIKRNTRRAIFFSGFSRIENEKNRANSFQNEMDKSEKRRT